MDCDRDKKAGYSLGMNHIGQIGIYAYVNGEWQGLMSGQKVPLLTWPRVAALCSPPFTSSRAPRPWKTLWPGGKLCSHTVFMVDYEVVHASSSQYV